MTPRNPTDRPAPRMPKRLQAAAEAGAENLVDLMHRYLKEPDPEMDAAIRSLAADRPATEPPERFSAHHYITRAYERTANVDSMIARLHEYGYEIRPVAHDVQTDESPQLEAEAAQGAAPRAEGLDVERLVEAFHWECYPGPLGTPHPRLPGYDPAPCDCDEVVAHMLTEYDALSRPSDESEEAR